MSSFCSPWWLCQSTGNPAPFGTAMNTVMASSTGTNANPLSNEFDNPKCVPLNSRMLFGFVDKFSSCSSWTDFGMNMAVSVILLLCFMLCVASAHNAALKKWRTYRKFVRAFSCCFLPLRCIFMGCCMGVAAIGRLNRPRSPHQNTQKPKPDAEGDHVVVEMSRRAKKKKAKPVTVLQLAAETKRMITNHHAMTVANSPNIFNQLDGWLPTLLAHVRDHPLEAMTQFVIPNREDAEFLGAVRGGPESDFGKYIAALHVCPHQMVRGGGVGQLTREDCANIEEEMNHPCSAQPSPASTLSQLSNASDKTIPLSDLIPHARAPQLPPLKKRELPVLLPEIYHPARDMLLLRPDLVQPSTSHTSSPPRNNNNNNNNDTLPTYDTASSSPSALNTWVRNPGTFASLPGK